MIFFLYLLILTGFIFNRGFFSLNGIFILSAGLILFIATSIKRKLYDLDFVSVRFLLLVVSLLSLVTYGGLYQQNFILIIVSFMLLVLNLFLSILLVIDTKLVKPLNIFFLMIATALLLRLFMIWSSPDPYIDVYDYLKNGALGFLSGVNPYSMTYTKLYADFTPNYYGYLPGMLYFTLPFVAIFKDPRYTFIFAEVVAALFIFKLSVQKWEKYIYPLIFLANPVSLYLVEQSYTEPLILFLLVAIAFLFIKKRYLVASLSFGILLSTKQYAVLLIPLFYKLTTLARAALARLAVSLIFAGFIILPFFLWNQADFFHDTITLQPSFPPRYEGLSFFSFLYRFGISYNFFLSTTIIGIFLLFVFTRSIKNLSQFFFLTSFAFLIFFFFNKWAFINYYYLVSQLLLVSGILKENKL